MPCSSDITSQNCKRNFHKSLVFSFPLYLSPSNDSELASYRLGFSTFRNWPPEISQLFLETMDYFSPVWVLLIFLSLPWIRFGFRTGRPECGRSLSLWLVQGWSWVRWLTEKTNFRLDVRRSTLRSDEIVNQVVMFYEANESRIDMKWEGIKCWWLHNMKFPTCWEIGVKNCLRYSKLNSKTQFGRQHFWLEYEET